MEIFDLLAIRLYEWAAKDFKREVQEEFPLLKRINESQLQRQDLPILKSLSPDRQSLLTTALLKRFHRRAVQQLGEKLSFEETKILKWYDEVRWSGFSQELKFDHETTNGQNHLKLDRKRFGVSLKDALHPILGDDFEKWGRYEFRYQQIFEKFIVFTYVDFGGDYHQLTYEHRIGPLEQPLLANDPRIGIMRISVLNWLGLSSQTMWNILTNDDTLEAAQTLALLCSHFLEALKGLFDGLESKK